MPYYSELGLSTPSSSAYSSLLFNGPYANHSSIIASNYQPFSKPLPRQIRGGFKPHLTTISEFNSPLRKINSPAYQTHSFRPVIKTINTADIDVSKNRYRRFEKYERPKTDSVERVPSPKKVESPIKVETPIKVESPKKDKSPQKDENQKTPESPRSSLEERVAKPNPTIRRDRATIRLQTIHKDTLEKEIGEIKSWRDNFKPEELGEGEIKRRKKSPGEILKDKFLIRSRSKENILKGQSIKKKRLSVKKSPSFHDICKAITSDSLDDDLNPGQPEEIQRRQSKQLSANTIIKEIRRRSTDLSEEDLKLLDSIITKKGDMSDEADQIESRGSVRKKKASKKKSVVENGISQPVSKTKEPERKSGIQRQRMQKRVKRTVSNSSNASEDSESNTEGHKNVVRDISQVDIEQTKYKPKTIITASDIDIEPTKPTLKAVVDDVEVEESPKKLEKKFRFNVIVEVEEQPKKPIITAPKMKLSDDQKVKVLLPKPKEPVITSILKKHSSVDKGQVLESKVKKVVKKPKPLILDNVELLNDSKTSESEPTPDVSSPQGKFNELDKKINYSTPNLANKFQVPLSKTQSASSPFQRNEPQSPIIKNKLVKSSTPSPTSTVKKVATNVQPKTPTKILSEGKSSSLPSSPLKKTSNFFNKENFVTRNKTEDKKEEPKEICKEAVEESVKQAEVTSPKLSEEVVRDKREKAWFEEDSSAPASPIYTVQNFFKKDLKKETEENIPQVSEEVKETPEEEQTALDKTVVGETQTSTDETEQKKKMISKRSLVQKATKDDPDLEVFVVPEPEPEPEPEPQPEEEGKFVPLQSNRMSQWMHPWKKPEQFDVCPVEIFARPKVIRGRHYPRPRGHPAPPPAEEEETSSEEESEDESEESDSSEEETSSEEECDSGFGSKDKGSSESRDSPTSNHANNPAFSLDFGDLPEEYCQSSTFAGFQKSGRITPPATTIPRFRKYCVEDFNFLKVLGKGSFGKVLLAELKGTEYYYAVKCLKKDVVLEDDDVECTLIERKVLALGTKHPYLCHLLCTFQTESHLFFVMEYLNGGDLMFHIQASGRFPEHQARFYGAEIISGLKFLHNKGIVYRDLKLDNVLLDFDGHVRIADFGMCKLQIFLDRMAETFCGTPDYMAPEIIKGQHYNQSVDWWSFGVLLYEMLLGQSPFSGCDEDELFWSICNEKPVLPKFLSSEAVNVLTLLLEKDASKRLGNRFCPHGDIQDHVFFRPIDWSALEARQLESPFKPNLQHPLDTQYFDKHFTVEKAKITPIDPTILQSMDQTQFQGFSYTNPNATDK